MFFIKSFYVSLFLSGDSHVSDWKGSFWLPPNASPETGAQDHLFYFIYGLSIFFFLLVIGFMVLFALRYRRKKKGERTSDIKGNTKLEIFWSAIPAILFIFIFAWGFIDWIKLNEPPKDSLEVKVVGRKWAWSFTDVRSGNEMTDLVVPVDTPVRLVMYSTDVIHGFYVPDFRINRDVLPNQYTVLWFKANQPGEHAVLCTQYCGTRHSQMVSWIKVLPKKEYDKAMIAMQGSGLTPVQLGERLFKNKSCLGCHDVSAQRNILVGPPLYGLFGKMHPITLIPSNTKKEVLFDEQYTRESILNPNFRKIDGYQNIMPAYQGQLSEKEILALIEYIKSLKK